MLKIDGGQKSGSGTIVRYSVGLAALLGEDLEITNIRSRRDKPGLRPQHLTAVRALATLCGGSIEGADVGSNRLIFRPRTPASGGNFIWNIGTSGSTTMLAFTLLTTAPFAKNPLTCQISGGLFQDFAPSAFHIQQALLPCLGKMGIKADLTIVRPGYVPTGAGIIELHINPIKKFLNPLRMDTQGTISNIDGTAISSHLMDRKVSDRMAEACRKVLSGAGYDSSIKAVYDETSFQSGAALAIFATSNAGSILGSDGAGAMGRSSENIGKGVARRLIEDIRSGATVDRFLADQLIFFAALADGTTTYRIPRITEHVETNLWLVESILGARSQIHDDLTVEIHGIGLSGRQSGIEREKVAV